MSQELENSNTKLSQQQTGLGKAKLGQSMLAGSLASLSKITLPRMFNQLVIFLLDGSGSMTFPGISGKSKGHEVHQAVINVLERLKDSKNESSFDVALWAFANESVSMFPIKPVIEFKLVRDCFNPCEFIKDYKKTNLQDTLISARELSLSYLEKYKDQNTKVLIIILGDGAINDYDRSLEIKESLNGNEKIVFSSILFESPAWIEKFDESVINRVKGEFSKLATSEANYMSTVDPEKIRSHMIQSITKISKIS